MTSSSDTQTEALKSQIRLRLALSASKIGTWEWNQSTNASVWDEQMYANFGQTPDSFPLTLQGILELIHPEDRETVAADIKNAMTKGIDYNRRYRIVMKDGEIRHLESRGTVLRDEQTGDVALVGINIDITEQQVIADALEQSERELKQRSELLQSILNCSPDGIAVCDENAKFVLYNKAAESLVGLGPVEFEPESWSDKYGCYHDEGVTPCATNDLPLVKALAGEQVRNNEVYLQNAGHPEGVWLSCNAAPLHHESGDLRGGMVLMRDITEQRRNLRLKQQRDEFVTTLIHDLKNTLMAAELNLPSFLSGVYGPCTEEQAKIVTLLLNANKDLTAMAENLVELFRYEDKEVLRIAETDPVPLLRKCVDSLSAFASSRSVQINFEPPKDSSSVMLDKVAIGHVITNLIHNAIKFTPPNGKVTVSVDDQSETIDFSVSDTGSGMSETEKAQVFSRLAKTAGERKSNSGTGLGLYLCAQIVRYHQGTLSLKSEVGAGSTFTISLAKS